MVGPPVHCFRTSSPSCSGHFLYSTSNVSSYLFITAFLCVYEYHIASVATAPISFCSPRCGIAVQTTPTLPSFAHVALSCSSSSPRGRSRCLCDLPLALPRFGAAPLQTRGSICPLSSPHPLIDRAFSFDGNFHFAVRNHRHLICAPSFTGNETLCRYIFIHASSRLWCGCYGLDIQFIMHVIISFFTLSVLEFFSLPAIFRIHRCSLDVLFFVSTSLLFVHRMICCLVFFNARTYQPQRLHLHRLLMPSSLWLPTLLCLDLLTGHCRYFFERILRLFPAL